jgi:hypothetical protein
MIRSPSAVSESSSSADDVTAGGVGGVIEACVAFSAIIDNKRPRKKLSDTLDSYV